MEYLDPVMFAVVFGMSILTFWIAFDDVSE